MKTNSAPNNINEYIAGFPADVQRVLQRARTTIRKAAPRAEEGISYRVPVFRLNGDLVYFAAFKKHIGLYPRKSAIQKFKKELADYDCSKGTIRLPLDQPIPYSLISKIVKFRVKENLARANAKRE